MEEAKSNDRLFGKPSQDSAMPGKINPYAEEINRIIAKRGKMIERIGAVIAETIDDPVAMEKAFKTIVLEYGERDAMAALRLVMDRIRRDFGKGPQELREQRWLDYVDGYGRYGRNIEFLPKSRFDMLADECESYSDKLAKGEKLTPQEEKRYSELQQLTLATSYAWKDLVPENPPIRPPQ